MHGHGGDAGKLGKWLIIANIVLATAAIGTTVWGWHLLGYGWSDAGYHSIKSIEMDEVYNRLRKGGEDAPGEKEKHVKPSRHEPDGHDEETANRARDLLDWGRWIGVVSTLLIAASTVVLLFYGKIRQSIARHFYKGHCLIVGDTVLANRLAHAIAGRVVHFCSQVEPAAGRAVRVAIGQGAQGLLAHGRVHTSRCLLIAMDDDVAGIDLALDVRRRCAAIAAPPRMILRLHDYWLAQRFHNLPSAERLEAVSEPALVARDAIRRFPPFLMVADQGAQRMHLLMLGEPDWLEAMMSEALLSATTMTFGKPAITFGCAEPETFRARLFERYPEIQEEVDLSFVQLAGHRPWELPGLDVSGLQLGSVTAVYCLFPADAQSICAYLAFEQAARTFGYVEAPVFVMSDGDQFSAPIPGSPLSPLQLVPIGGLRQMVRACSLDGDGPDQPERRFHAAYLEFAASDGEAAMPWGDLKENYRISNRRAVAHIPAKLFDAGFDLRKWMAAHDVWSRLPSLAPNEALCCNPEERERLARLEHKRWMIDRRLGGWRYGPLRDNTQRVHPDLVPFDQLSPQTQDYDRKFIDLLEQIMRSSPDGMTR